MKNQKKVELESIKPLIDEWINKAADYICLSRFQEAAIYEECAETLKEQIKNEN